jgi:hypothetical protein
MIGQIQIFTFKKEDIHDLKKKASMIQALYILLLGAVLRAILAIESYLK